MTYRARIKWSGKNARVYQWAGIKGILNKPNDKTRMPVPVPTFPSPKFGKKIEHKYTNVMLADLLALNPSKAGRENILRINNFLFNSARNKHLIKFKDKLQWWKNNYVQYPMPKGQYVVGENILMEGEEITVLEERGRFVRIAPQVARLREVEISTGKMFVGGLRWRVMPDKRTDAIWLEKALIERI